MTLAGEDILVGVSFEAGVIYWRGPSPFFFAPIPPPYDEKLRRVAKAVTYGWGMVPVAVKIAEVTFTTALFPKDGTYFLPIKAAVRRKANITAGDLVRIEMTVQPAER